MNNPLTPQQPTGGCSQQPTKSNNGLFALIFVGLFALLIIGALRFSNFSSTQPVIETLADDPATLPSTDFDLIPETPVITQEGTLAIPLTEDQVIEFKLPEGGIILQPDEEIQFNLGPNGTDSDTHITIEIDDEGATVTDAEGNVTRQDGQGNVLDP